MGKINQNEQGRNLIPEKREKEIKAILTKDAKEWTETELNKLRLFFGVLSLCSEAEYVSTVIQRVLPINGSEALEEVMQQVIDRLRKFREQKKRLTAVELKKPTVIGKTQTNGDSEGVSCLFTARYSGRFELACGRYAKVRALGQGAASFTAEVKQETPLEFYDRDVFFTFWNQAQLNISNDGRNCMVTLAGLCRALFGSKKTISEEKKSLVSDSIARLSKAYIQNLDITGLIEQGRIARDSYIFGDIQAQKINTQAFLQCTEMTYTDKSGNTGVMYVFPASLSSVVYELARELKRITEYNPALIPNSFKFTPETYSSFCLFRNRMSWFKKSKDAVGRVDFLDFMKTPETATKKQIHDHRKMMKKILTHWHDIGACTFEYITTQVRGRAVETGVQFKSINRALIFDNPALDDSQS